MNLVHNTATFLVGRVGLGIQGAKVLTVRGRKTGRLYSLVVNPLVLNDEIYLLSPRGETSWVKNTRHDAYVYLRRGLVSHRYRALEVRDPGEKVTVMHHYLQRWGWQVKSIMGFDKSASNEQLRAIIDAHPVFMLKRA